MSAYMMVSVKMYDREKFLAGYAPAAAKLVAKYGGEYLFMSADAELLEGTLDGYTSVLVSKWPSKEVILEFWNSPEYKEAAKLREGICDVQVLITGTLK